MMDEQKNDAPENTVPWFVVIRVARAAGIPATVAEAAIRGALESITEDPRAMQRAWDAYSSARDDGEDEPVKVMQAAVRAAFLMEPLRA